MEIPNLKSYSDPGSSVESISSENINNQAFLNYQKNFEGKTNVYNKNTTPS